MMRNGSLVSYGAVALVAAALSAAATLGIGNFVQSAFAQTPAATGTIPLLTQPLADLPGREVRITLLDRDPGNIALAVR